MTATERLENLLDRNGYGFKDTGEAMDSMAANPSVVLEWLLELGILQEDVELVSPKKYPRNGAILRCGCWTYNVLLGTMQGRDFANCDYHGSQLITKANVLEPNVAVVEAVYRTRLITDWSEA